MKKTVFLIISLFLFTSLTQAQLLSERTNGLVTIGGELFTDFSTGASYDNALVHILCLIFKSTSRLTSLL